MNNAIKIALASALITAAALKAVPALAEPAPSVAVSVVATGDLDLSTVAGKRQLDIRLARAARDVCGIASDSDLKGKNEIRQCRDNVLADARVQQESLAATSVRTIAVTASR